MQAAVTAESLLEILTNLQLTETSQMGNLIEEEA